MTNLALLDALSQGNGKSNRIVYECLPQILKNRGLLEAVIDGCSGGSSVLKARCVQLLEKISEEKPEWLLPHKRFILETLTKIRQKEVQWSMAKMLTRLEFSEAESMAAFDYCMEAFNATDSRITMALMLEAIVTIAKQYPTRYAHQADKLLQQSLHSPIPALSARARKLSRLRRTIRIFNAD